MKLLVNFISALCLCAQVCYAQFPGPVGQPGTTAMYKDSSAFVAWASSCKVVRGYQNISSPTDGYANIGDSSCVIGLAGTNGVVSLGDGGYATVQFNVPVTDGFGADFAVFENGFDDLFLELAFVEASSDGIHFFRFPATSNTDVTTQTASFDSTDATKINNLAGKYRGLYGTPFDLADIPNDIQLNKQAITHIRVIDVVGCMQNQYCTRDKNGNKINDPWPTPFGSGGFDLDAVGVIHNQTHVGVDQLTAFAQVNVFPNPATDVLHVTSTNSEYYSVSITSLLGEIVFHSDNEKQVSTIHISELKQGIYEITITSDNGVYTSRFVKN